MTMQQTPLNMAHYQHRRADIHLRNKQYDNAIQCHQYAAELLLDAMKSTSSSRAIESITLQHRYHLKQKDLIKARKEQYERVKKAMEHLKNLSKDPISELMEHESRVQIEIYKMINETDSLLQILKRNETCASSEKINEDSVVIATDALAELNDKTGTKKLMDTRAVTDELQSVNQSLYGLVDRLVMQAEVVKEENVLLKNKVDYLEEERRKYLVNYGMGLTQQTDFGLLSDMSVSTDNGMQHSCPPTEFNAETGDRGSEDSPPVEKAHFDLTAFNGRLM